MADTDHDLLIELNLKVDAVLVSLNNHLSDHKKIAYILLSFLLGIIAFGVRSLIF